MDSIFKPSPSNNSDASSVEYTPQQSRDAHEDDPIVDWSFVLSSAFYQRDYFLEQGTGLPPWYSAIAGN